MRPQLPRAYDLLPYLHAIDTTRFYSNHGPLSVELGRRLAELFRLPANAVACTSSGTPRSQRRFSRPLVALV
jgi:hypothetical protein